MFHTITLKLLNHYLVYLLGSDHNFRREQLLKSINHKKVKGSISEKNIYVFSPDSTWTFLLSNETTRNAIEAHRINNIDELDYKVTSYLDGLPTPDEKDFFEDFDLLMEWDQLENLELSNSEDIE